jgi:hypothetical protein
MTDATAPFVGPVGIVVQPAIGNTIVTALRIYTANDADGRDPANYVLEGSIDGFYVCADFLGDTRVARRPKCRPEQPLAPLTQRSAGGALRQHGRLQLLSVDASTM